MVYIFLQSAGLNSFRMDPWSISFGHAGFRWPIEELILRGLRSSSFLVHCVVAGGDGVKTTENKINWLCCRPWPYEVHHTGPVFYDGLWEEDSWNGVGTRSAMSHKMLIFKTGNDLVHHGSSLPLHPRKSIPRRNWFSQGIDSVESMPVVSPL